jgi:hypothetical protein
MKKLTRITCQLPPISETWRELYFPGDSRSTTTWQPVKERKANAVRLLKDVRTLVSLEEVYGKGLLEKFVQSNGGYLFGDKP